MLSILIHHRNLDFNSTMVVVFTMYHTEIIVQPVQIIMICQDRITTDEVLEYSICAVILTVKTEHRWWTY